MTGNEIRLIRFDEIRRADGFRSKAQVGDGHGAGLLRVIDEVALGKVIGLFADDLDRVLVRANGSV